VSGNHTHGFDLVVELSENRLGSVVGEFIVPQSLTQSFLLGSLSVPISVSGRTIPLGGTRIHPGNLVDFRVDYSSVTIAGISVGGAEILITARIVESGGSPRQIAVTFPSPPTITLRDSAALDGLLAASGTDVTRDQALALASAALLTYLQSAAALPSIPIGTMIGSGSCALSLADLRVRTIDHAMAIMLSFSSPAIPHPTPPDPSAFTTSGLGGRDAVLFVSNTTLLGVATCFASNPPSPIAGATFTTDGQCRRITHPMPLTLDGRNVTLTQLGVCVVENRIVIDGFLHYAETAFSVDVSFRAPMGFSCRADGSISLDFNPNDVQTDATVTIEWWVYVAALFLLPLIAAFVSIIIAFALTVIVLLAAPIASAVIASVARNAIGSLGASIAGAANTSLLPPQLQRLFGAIHCDSVVLDDLNMLGTLNSPRAASIELRPHWEVTEKVQTGSGGVGLLAYTTDRVARRVTFSALPTSMIDPVAWTWTLAGAALTGSGTRTIGGVAVTYAVNGPSIQISTPLGTDLDLVLAVHGRDRDGLVQSASTLVSITPDEVEHAHTNYELLEFLLHNGFYARGTPDRLIDPAGPDPPPDAVLRQQVELGAIQALAAGTRIDAAQLAKTAGLSLRSVAHA
jgi:hypothetical protein